jgi:ABC-type antimicrobial peptide transport system permease subunit
MGERASSLVGVVAATIGALVGGLLCGAIGLALSRLVAPGPAEGIYLGLWVAPVFLGAGAIVGGILGVTGGLALLRRRGR